MKQPNILLITTDQQRFDTLAALGNSHIYTPHLDWLCDEGIAFTRAYTDCPICMPARATLMTGRHGYSLGLTGNDTTVLPLAANPTLPGLLTQAGYQTRAQGKMHFHPMRANYGFEHMELPMDYYRDCGRHPDAGLPKEHGVGENEVTPVISTVDEAHSLTHWTVRRSIDFIETRDETRPFFLWTSFAKPHPPFDPCASYWALYDRRAVPEPVIGDWSQTVAATPQGYLQSTYCLNNVYRMTPDQIGDMRRAYYACITQIDYQLGLLFARLRELQLLENTWIIFTSDHGDMLGDHHMGAKSLFLEGAAHIPLIVRPPTAPCAGLQQGGRRVDRLVELADVLPTILTAAGVNLPVGVEGTDLMQTAGPNPPPERTFIGQCADRFFCVLREGFKYQWTSAGGAELLFDLARDPYEQRNLAADPAQRGRMEESRRTLATHLKRYAPALVERGTLKPGLAILAPAQVAKWPGFHSTQVNTDVLH
jgi:arylsulfatase A-like enzyme